jgi:Fe2+ transport system protein FeoA
MPRRKSLRRLTDISAGASVRLRGHELEAHEARLLAAMGLTEGCRLDVRAAGDPTIVAIRSTRLGLARALAQRVLVEGP